MTPDRGPPASAGVPVSPEAAAAGRAALGRLRRFGGDALVEEMARMFLADMPARLTLAREAVAASDAGRAAYAAHAMKSSAAQFGAVALAELCATAERQAADGGAGAVAPLLDPIAVELAAFGAWLDGELGAPAPGALA